MTDRKPTGVKFETWVERQIREAEERGAFRDLPGMGEPLPDDATYDERWWLKAKLRREQLEVLPPSLALRREVERTLDELHRLPTEEKVRARVTDLNRQILDELLTPHPGPALGLRLLKPDEVVAAWRDRRSAAQPPTEPRPTDVATTDGRVQRRWFRRRR